MVPHVIQWLPGEPSQVVPGLCVHYESGKIELVGSQKHVLTGPVRRYTYLISTHELEWVEAMSNRRGL